MINYNLASREDLIKEREELQKRYDEYKSQGLSLNMARGKPSPKQLDLSKDLYKNIDSFIAEDGTDARNYGVLQGIPEMRKLFADILDTVPEKIFVGGSSSLTMMHDTMARAMIFGEIESEKPWAQVEDRKWLCPAPGYDRHFKIAEMFGFKLIPISMDAWGPNISEIEEYVKNPTVLGMWCVPCYSNPDGYVYSETICEQLASMKTAAPDFRIYWDNAYMKHHLYEEKIQTIPDMLALCEKTGNPNRVYEFTSFSKITLAGSSVACMATNKDNMDFAISHINKQCIDCNKVNQLAHAKYFKDESEVEAHMRKQADILRPKFQKCIEIFNEEFSGNGDICYWTDPNGGYFISLYAYPHTAKNIWNMCKDAGVTLTDAGAAYPYGNDPMDAHLRIAPSYPSLADIEKAIRILCVCVKITAIDEILNDKLRW